MLIKGLVTGIQHIGIPTYDIEKTIEFYKSLDFEVIYRTVNKKSNEKVAFLQLCNIQIETYQSLQKPMQPGSLDHISIDVTDIEKVFIQVSKGDYKILNDSVQFLPFFEYGVEFFTILGPNGEKIEFCEKLK